MTKDSLLAGERTMQIICDRAEHQRERVCIVATFWLDDADADADGQASGLWEEVVAHSRRQEVAMADRVVADPKVHGVDAWLDSLPPRPDKPERRQALIGDNPVLLSAGIGRVRYQLQCDLCLNRVELRDATLQPLLHGFSRLGRPHVSLDDLNDALRRMATRRAGGSPI